MNLRQRFLRFLIGFSIGSLMVVFFLNKKSAKCNYLPNDRVIGEIEFRPKKYSENVLQFLKEAQLDTTYVLTKIVPNGEIDFEASQPRKKPCGEYLMYSETEKGNFQLKFTKCRDHVFFNEIKKQ